MSPRGKQGRSHLDLLAQLSARRARAFWYSADADAICEKPLALNPWNIDAIAEMERQTGRKVNTILQLRLHPVIADMAARIKAEPTGKVHDVDLTYTWYYTSWKGDDKKSGGIATNIGVHFFDMLTHVFGSVKNIAHHRAMDCAAGYLELERARVRWFLSINARDLPREVQEKKTTYRSITVDGKELEFSEGFTDPGNTTESYREIVAGRGFPLDEVRLLDRDRLAVARRRAEPGQGASRIPSSPPCSPPTAGISTAGR